MKIECILATRCQEMYVDMFERSSLGFKGYTESVQLPFDGEMLS